jgi:hypothetical protein
MNYTARKGLWSSGDPEEEAALEEWLKVPVNQRRWEKAVDDARNSLRKVIEREIEAKRG